MKKILVPVDFNPLATSALQFAAMLAESTGASLIVTYADTFDPPAEFTSGQTAAIAASIAGFRKRAGEELERYAHENVPETLPMKTEVREALPLPAIFAAIEEHQPDLVLMGTHGRGGLSRLLYGSVTEAVLRSAKVPVLTINQAGTPRMPHSILCLVTGDAEGEAAQRVSLELAAKLKAPCRVLAVQRDSMAEALSSPECVAADLVVIAGEVHSITRHSTCPVLHVPAGYSG